MICCRIRVYIEKQGKELNRKNFEIPLSFILQATKLQIHITNKHSANMIKKACYVRDYYVIYFVFTGSLGLGKIKEGKFQNIFCRYLP